MSSSYFRKVSYKSVLVSYFQLSAEASGKGGTCLYSNGDSSEDLPVKVLFLGKSKLSATFLGVFSSRFGVGWSFTG